MRTLPTITIGVLVLIIFGLGYFLWAENGTPAQVPNESSSPTAPAIADSTTEIKIALLDTTGSGSGKSRGCDTVALVTRSVPQTSAPLTAALQALFAEKEGEAGGSQYNFIARTNDTLAFERAAVESGVAKIYLTGRLSGLAGVCDDPRAAIQIEETALQFPTVERVQIYLNGVATDLTPNEGGM